MSFSTALSGWVVAHPYYSLALALYFCLTGLAVVRKTRRKQLPYPPGPKGYPVIGSLLDVPTEKSWLTYAEWGRTYGERPHDTWSTGYFNTISTRRHGIRQSTRPTNPCPE